MRISRATYRIPADIKLSDDGFVDGDNGGTPKHSNLGTVKRYSAGPNTFFSSLFAKTE